MIKKKKENDKKKTDDDIGTNSNKTIKENDKKLMMK